MTLYGDDILSAQDDIDANGAPITFTRGPGVAQYNDATGLFTGGNVKASSSAIQVKSNPARLAAKGLTIVDPATYLVAASRLAGFVPMPETDKMTFNGITTTVKDVDPVQPDGVAILYRVVGER